MQKRSKKRYALAYHPVSLPDDFPIVAEDPYVQTDRPITLLHRHNYLELGYCYEGSGIFIVEDKIMEFHAGDATAIGQHELHLAQSSRGTESRWVWVNVRPELLLADSGERDYAFITTDGLSGPGFYNVIKGKEHPELCAGVKRLIDELHGKGRGYRTLAKGVMWEIMVRLHRMVPDDGSALSRNTDTMAAVAPALSYCARHFREPVPVAALARVCSMSVPHFRRIFKAGTGQGPHGYLNALRIRTACMLLASTDMRIIDIGHECGFGTLSSFNRRFKELTGMAPREWRKRQ